MDTVTAPIYATCTTGSAITSQQIAYEANPYIYGLTSSGSKVLLAGTPIIGVSVDNPTDFRVDDYSGPISTSNPMAYNDVWVAANVLGNHVTTSSAILTITILGADGAIHSLLTILHSSMAPPVAGSLSLSVDTSLPGISVNGAGDNVTLSLAALQACGFVTGNYLTRYDENGSSQHRARIYFYAIDQYGTRALPLAQVIQVEATTGFSVDSKGQITCTPLAIVPGSSTTLRGITNNGLEKTIKINFVN